MVTKREHISYVLDAGARYGQHPSWKPFTGEAKFFLFEPDSEEAQRLQKKYAAKGDRFVVESVALSNKPGTLTLNILGNKAMSTTLERSGDSPFFTGERSEEVVVTRKIKIKADSVDNYCAKRGVQLDFLKLDTEGTESDILKGSEKQLSGILGVRCEVNFGRVFKGGCGFSDVHDFLLDRDFFLLNLGYDGRGEYFNEFVAARGRYGVLTDTDAVWMLSFRGLAKLAKQHGPAMVLKYAAFALLNDAPDVAIEVLLRANKEWNLRYDSLEETKLFEFLYVALHKHFYSLKWQPAQSLKKHATTFKAALGVPMKRVHEYNSSTLLNPD